MEKVYTAKEAAEILKVTEDYVRQMARDGRLKCIYVGRFIRITQWALNDFLKKPE